MLGGKQNMERDEDMKLKSPYAIGEAQAGKEQIK